MSIAPGSMTEQELDEQWTHQMQNQLVQCGRQSFGSEAPAEVWMRPSGLSGHWYTSHLDPPEPDAVRYVRADLYERACMRLAVVRSWNEAPCLEPLGTDYPR